MGILQEGAIIVGDLITQPVRRFLVKKLTGEKYCIKRNTILFTDIHPTKDKMITKYKVEWKLEKVS